MIPGNSVITVTPGKVIGIGAKKVDVDNPIYPGNSGSPIVVMGTNEVIGVLTEAHILELDAVSKKSFENEDSRVKSEIRYFGHRIDNVKRWQGMNWNDFRKTSDQLATLKFELESLANYLFKDDNAYEAFEELAKSNERAVKVLNKRASGKDKVAAIRDVTRFMRFLATRRLQKIEREPMYFIHKQNFASLKRLFDHIVSAVKVL